MGHRSLLLTLALVACTVSVHAAESLTVLPGAVDTRPVAIYLDELPEGLAVDGIRLLGPRGATWTGQVLTVAPDQSYQVGPITRRGTLVLCSFDDIGLPALRSSLDVTPVLDLAPLEGSTARARSVVGKQPFVLGRPAAASGWTLVLLAGLLLAFGHMASDRRLARPGLAGLLCEPDGRLSLSRCQAALFTLAVGALTWRYGLFHTVLPELPGTLAAVVAVSMGTAGAAWLRTRRPDQGADAPAVAPRPARLADLICVDVAGHPQLSLPRAQMVFWTLLTVGLFVLRSLADDTLWAIPSELVALMGLSSLGYLGGKFAPPRRLVYPAVPTLRVGEPMTRVEPSVQEGITTSFSVTPALPPGLVLDPSSGALCGTPRHKASPEAYTIVAHGATGSASATVELAVAKADR